MERHRLVVGVELSHRAPDAAVAIIHPVRREPCDIDLRACLRLDCLLPPFDRTGLIRDRLPLVPRAPYLKLSMIRLIGLSGRLEVVPDAMTITTLARPVLADSRALHGQP